MKFATTVNLSPRRASIQCALAVVLIWTASPARALSADSYSESVIALISLSSQSHIIRPALAPSLSFAKKSGEGNSGGSGNSGQGNNNKDDKDKKDKKDKHHREDDDSEADADAGEQERHDEVDDEPDHPDESEGEQDQLDQGDGEQQQADEADGESEHSAESEGEQDQLDQGDGEQQQAGEADGEQEQHDEAGGTQEVGAEADSGQQHDDEAGVVSNEEGGNGDLVSGDAAVEETGADATTEAAVQATDEGAQEQDSAESNTTPFLLLSGAPPEAVTAGELYLFTPTVESNREAPATFAIDGLPHWAGFDEITGELFGTPDEAHVGLYDAITISATDGVVETSLPTFSIEVVAPGAAQGAVTLSWMPPTENEDGSYLVDLAGYWIYWGNNPGQYTHWMRIDNPGLTTIVIEDLVPGSWEFAMTSFNAHAVESGLSNAISRFIE